ncbi:oxalate decarboxylase [Ancylobacter sp. 3268]|uniref:YoaK family protein n=1 Tax=Ancylobacter sp. 3268 TaxID=2817752 RepID=UPI0028652E77|nr:YoaK family protein [Ancylobacter sp. 3268]MDR6951433.1 oxalate decarboxylase [Ancylobacter sp. 3268]
MTFDTPTGTRLRPLLFATLATLIAGFVDAVGYAYLGGLFLSFMSGNSTRLGISLASGQLLAAVHAAIVIGCFVVGALIGTLIADATARWKLVLILAVEVVLFTLAAALAQRDIGFVALLPVAVAMGLQNAVHQLIAGADVGKSFVTGALFGMGQALARRLTGRGSAAEAASYALSWAAFVIGALIGALMLAGTGLTTALAVAGGLLAVLAAVALAFHRHLGPAVAQYGGD